MQKVHGTTDQMNAWPLRFSASDCRTPIQLEARVRWLVASGQVTDPGAVGAFVSVPACAPRTGSVCLSWPLWGRFGFGRNLVTSRL